MYSPEVTLMAKNKNKFCLLCNLFFFVTFSSFLRSFVRFAASPYYANDYWSLRDWRDDPERYWSNGMDRVVALARRLGGSTRLVPDLLWNPFAFADLCGEPLSALFNGSDTCTRHAVAEYVTQAARRYSSADEILFW